MIFLSIFLTAMILIFIELINALFGVLIVSFISNDNNTSIEEENKLILGGLLYWIFIYPIIRIKNRDKIKNNKIINKLSKVNSETGYNFNHIGSCKYYCEEILKYDYEDLKHQATRNISKVISVIETMDDVTLNSNKNEINKIINNCLGLLKDILKECENRDGEANIPLKDTLNKIAEDIKNEKPIGRRE